MSVYPTDLDHPRTHIVWRRIVTMGLGKVVFLAAYKTYPGKPKTKALASITISTYEEAASTNYTGAILAEKEFALFDAAEAEVRAVNWLTSLIRLADWGQP